MSKNTNGTTENETENEAENDEPGAFYPERGPGREEMVSNYLPEQNEWQAKTHLDPTDPAAIAALREIGDIYPEVEELQGLIDEFLDDFMQTKTSVGGMSREEYRKIMMSMYGGSDGEGDSSMAMKLVAADDD